MKLNYRLFTAFALLVLLQSNVLAQTSPTISYQGTLQNNGSALNGIDTLKILIYSVETGGSPIYSETQAVSVANGVFNMAIGSVTPLLPTLDFTRQYYLAVSVNGAPELSPRSEVSFAPYAFRALNADTASYASTATIAKGVSGGVVTNINGFYGPLTLSGANGITIANSVGNLTIGNNGVQSLNGVGGILSLAGAGGTTVTHSGTTFTITSTGSGSSGVGSLLNFDNTITIKNPNGPIDTINLASQNAASGQVLSWNGSAWRPETLSAGQGAPDSINDLADARSFEDNVFLGGHSGVNDSISNMVGNNNTAIGILAMNLNRTGNDNTACGYYALAFNTSGDRNEAFGSHALISNTTASGNVAIGFYALSEDTSGWDNVAIGSEAMEDNRHGIGNVALGVQSLGSNDTGNWNTACGAYAMHANLNGQYNVGIGNFALLNNVNGNNNTAIGDSAGPISSALSNTGALGYGAQPTLSNEIVLGNSAVTSLYCQGAYAATTAASANMVVSASGQIMRSTSSARYKTDIHDLDINTDKLYDLRPVSYISKIDGKPYFGLVAEDVAKVIPDLAEYARSKDVIPGSTSDALIPDAVKYPMLSVLLLDELKKEHARVEEQEKRAESQAQKMESQEKIIADLEKRMDAMEASQKAMH